MRGVKRQDAIADRLHAVRRQCARFVICGLALVVAHGPVTAGAAEAMLDAYGLNAAERFHGLALAAFFIGYFFLFGAAVGSFLNVVVYRLPRGMNLLWPPSRCPRCGASIRFEDNIPILSWLRLRGKCRVCAAPISTRYLLVETVTALIFLFLALGELLTAGANLPLGPVYPRGGVYFILWETKWVLVGMYLYHACLLSLLLALGLIAWDRQPIPRRLIGFGFAVGLFAPLLFPGLRPLPWSLALSSGGLVWRGLTDGLLGYFVGLCCGGLLGRAATARGERRRHATSAADTLALVGAFLGWQATVSVAAWAAFGLSLDTVWSACRLRPRRWPVVSAIGPAVAVQLALWRWLHARLAADDPSGGMVVTTLAAAALGLLAIVTRCWGMPLDDAAPTSMESTTKGF